MITNIALENFKCFRKVEVNPRPITVFVGPNGTGKSSVLQALALLKQSAGSDNLNFQGPFVNVRSLEQLYYHFDSLAPEMELRFSGFYKPPSPGSKERAEQVGEADGGTFTRGRHHENIAIGAGRNILDDLKLVPAVRGLVKPTYNIGSQNLEDIPMARGLSQQEEQTATNLNYSRPLEERLSSLINRVTGVGLRALPVPAQSVEINALTPAGEVNIVAEGFGTNALILLFHQLVRAIEGATILNEEPEIHLHPKAQAELASVLVEEAQAEDKQIIMTTHSEHILGRLLTLVAEKKLAADELAIYAFEKDEMGECTAKELDVTKDGKVVGGVKDFFESDLDELERYIKALQSDR